MAISMKPPGHMRAKNRVPRKDISKAGRLELPYVFGRLVARRLPPVAAGWRLAMDHISRVALELARVTSVTLGMVVAERKGAQRR